MTPRRRGPVGQNAPVYPFHAGHGARELNAHWLECPDVATLVADGEPYDDHA